MTWSEIFQGIVALAFAFVIIGAALKFVFSILYRLSGGYDREIRDELQDIRERLD